MKVFSLFLTSDDNCDNKTQALPVNTYCNHKKTIFLLFQQFQTFLRWAWIRAMIYWDQILFYKYFSMYDKVSHFHASDDEY